MIELGSDGVLRFDMDENGNFNVEGITKALVLTSVAPRVYHISADVLKEAVNRTPILTGLLRSTGNIRLENSPSDLMRMQLASSLRSKPKKSGAISPGSVSVSFAESGRTVATKCLYAMARSGSSSFKFKIGFHTSYARKIHQGDWQYLGGRSSKANKKKKRSGAPGRYAGKVGKRFLKRAWVDNEGRYITYFKSGVGR